MKDACTQSVNIYTIVMLYKYIPLNSNQRYKTFMQQI